MDVMELILVLVVIAVWLGTLVWLANDVYDAHGSGGCLVLLSLYLFLAPIFPLIVLGYLYMKHRLWHSPVPSGDSGERLSQYNWRAALQNEDGGPEPARAAGPVNLSASDSDEEIDLLLAEGRAEEAASLVREKFETAKSFGDTKGITRYRKYADYLRYRERGGK